MEVQKKRDICKIIEKYAGKKGALIPILQAIQSQEKYLSKESMRFVSEKTGYKLAEIYGVATFYTMFRLKPQGKHIIRICKGTACHVSGANALSDSLREQLNLKEGEDTTENGQFTIMEVACLGCCSLAPVIMVDNNTHGKLDAKSLKKVIRRYK